MPKGRGGDRPHPARHRGRREPGGCQRPRARPQVQARPQGVAPRDQGLLAVLLGALGGAGLAAVGDAAVHVPADGGGGRQVGAMANSLHTGVCFIISMNDL